MNVVILSLIAFVAGFLESLNLLVLYPLVNYGLDQRSEGKLMDLFNQLLVFSNTENVFLFYCYLLIVISIISVSMRAVTFYASYNLLRKITEYFYKEVFQKYLSLGYDYYLKNKQGKLIHIATISSGNASSMVLESINTITSFLNFFILTGSVLILSWQGTIMLLILGLLYITVTRIISSKIIFRYGQKEALAARNKLVNINELISGIKTIKVFSASKMWKEKYNRNVEDQTRFQFIMLMGRVVPESLMKISLFLIIAGSGIFINMSSDSNIISLIPLYSTFAIVAIRLLPAAQMLGNSIMNLVSLAPNTMFLYELLNEPSDSSQMNDVKKEKISSFNKEISFNKVVFEFEESKQTLFNDLSFNLEKNRTTAIVGSSGVGKSTIINLLFRLHPVKKGSITIDGVNIENYKLASYLSKFGYVSQETFIFNSTIKENIRFGMFECSEKMIINAAKMANAHDFITEAQHGYETIVGDSGLKLSGGQRQRIAIARAMLRRPEIMVFDEATSSLDNISEQKVQNAINLLSKHTTVLVIAHRLSTIIDADNILVISDGKIVEEGKHEALLKLKGEYSRLYKLQSDIVQKEGETKGSHFSNNTENIVIRSIETNP